MKKIVAVFSLLLILLSTTSISVFALEGSSSSEDGVKKEVETNREKIHSRSQEREAELKSRLASRAAEAKDKLNDARLRVCEVHQKVIKTRSQSLVARAQTQFTVFGSIAERVETFYTETLLPKGITVSNYEDLKTDIQTQKEGAQAAIAEAKSVADSFDCASDNPKSQIIDFNAKMKLAIEAMKDYRTAIKNLIVTVRSVVKDSETATSSAENQ